MSEAPDAVAPNQAELPIVQHQIAANLQLQAANGSEHQALELNTATDANGNAHLNRTWPFARYSPDDPNHADVLTLSEAVAPDETLQLSSVGSTMAALRRTSNGEDGTPRFSLVETVAATDEDSEPSVTQRTITESEANAFLLQREDPHLEVKDMLVSIVDNQDPAVQARAQEILAALMQDLDGSTSNTAATTTSEDNVREGADGVDQEAQEARIGMKARVTRRISQVLGWRRRNEDTQSDIGTGYNDDAAQALGDRLRAEREAAAQANILTTAPAQAGEQTFDELLAGPTEGAVANTSQQSQPKHAAWSPKVGEPNTMDNLGGQKPAILPAVIPIARSAQSSETQGADEENAVISFADLVAGADAGETAPVSEAAPVIVAPRTETKVPWAALGAAPIPLLATAANRQALEAQQQAAKEPASV